MSNRRSFSMVMGLMRDGFGFVVQHIRSNRLRTALSLAGVSIGIFTIIAIFVVIDSLKTMVNENFAQLGDNTIMVDKWGWGMGGEYQWWLYARNPYPSREDFLALRDNGRQIGAVLMSMISSGAVRYQSREAARAPIMGVTQGAERFVDLTLAQGRGLSVLDYTRGSAVCLLGAEIAEQLFPQGDAVGRVLRIKGRSARVVGVLRGQSSLMSVTGNMDDRVIIPFDFLRTMVDPRRVYAQIAVQGAKGVDDQSLRDDLRRVLRASRGLQPSQPDNFALNSVSSARDALEQFYRVLNLAGLLIGGLSVVVGGFGIANIMFVSVRERTRIIGIQKALGARRGFILGQFLLESTALSVLGGGVGLALLGILVLSVGRIEQFQIHMRISHVLMGVAASAVIGIVSGYLPARNAARLSPVKAMDSAL